MNENLFAFLHRQSLLRRATLHHDADYDEDDNNGLWKEKVISILS